MVAARGSAGLAVLERLLLQGFYRALVIALRGKKLVSALDDDGHIRGPVAAGAAPRGGCNAEHEPQAPALRVGWPAEAQAQSAALGPCAALAMQLRAAPIDIGVDRAAHAGAQIPALPGQATVRWGHCRS